MKKEWLVKTLALVIIFLFIAVSFQPAFAVEPKLSSNNIKKVDDCNCKGVESQNLVRVKLLFIQLKVVNNILSKRFGHIPEVKEICNDISGNINSFNPLSDYPIFCAILEHIYSLLLAAAYYVESVWEELEASGLLGEAISMFLVFPLFFLLITCYVVELTGAGYYCWDYPSITSYKIKQIFSRIEYWG
jgi:hypothetical protein